MRNPTAILSIAFLISVVACSSRQSEPAANNTSAPAQSPAAAATAASATTPASSSSATTATPKVDACSLLTGTEIQAVQGESLKTTKPSQQAGHDFVIGVCYYELPTPSNSVSVSLAESNAGKPGRVKEFWEHTFAEGERGESRKEREGEEGEIEEGAPPRKIARLGEEAFWFASPIGGVLYVLKGDHYIRISVGGKGNSEAKLKKSTALAKKALARL